MKAPFLLATTIALVAAVIPDILGRIKEPSNPASKPGSHLTDLFGGETQADQLDPIARYLAER